jgi:ribonuclease E
VVIDFIDMKDAKHKSEVERIIKKSLKMDKAKTNVGRISKFGLMEMSRQRIRPSIEFGSFQPCGRCHGKGLVPSTETLGIRFLRKLQLETLKPDIVLVKGVLPNEVADYVLNSKRKEIVELELRRRLSIEIVGDRTMVPGEGHIECHHKAEGSKQ